MARATNCDLLLKICTELGKMRGDIQALGGLKDAVPGK